MKAHNKINLHFGLYLMIIFLSIGTYMHAYNPNPPTPPTPGGGTIGAPVVTTQATSNIGVTQAIGNGQVTVLGYPAATAYGICWSTSPTPTTSDSKVSKGAATVTGPYTVTMTGLSPGTTYYVRSFATNSLGTVYGDEVNFTTLLMPVITWSNPADIVYGTLLSATQLNAIADVPGSFVYDPAIGTKLNVGTNQNLITTFTPTDGGMYSVVKDTVKINVAKANPVITWSDADNIIYGTLLSATQLNATADVPGNFVYDPAIGTKIDVGLNQNLITTFTPTDASNYNVVKDTVLISVFKASPIITWSDPADIVYGTLLSATQLNATANVPGSFVYNPAIGTKLDARNRQGLFVSFTPTESDKYNNTSTSVLINVKKATPVISWSNPADIVYGTLLSATQLNATANVPGSFAYNYSIGTKLNEGANQKLITTFTPTDGDNYNVVKDTVRINVITANPVISWSDPSDIVYGTLLNATQLNATADVPGSFVYSPAIGTKLEAGDRQRLSVVFTPTESDKYNSMNYTVFINVRKATPNISWTTNGDYVYGVKVADDVLKASADIDGQMTYSPAAGTVIGAGSNKVVKAYFTPSDTKNYLSVSDSVSVSINKANPVTVWSDPSDIVYGTLLGETQLNATANIAGSFIYSPASGVKLNAGNNQKLMLTFNPADAANYNSVKDTAIINVKKGTPVISWSNPADISYGALLDSKQLNATADVAGKLTYNPASGSKLEVGDGQILTVTLTPTDAANYVSISDTVYLNVKKLNPVITWAKPSDINYGTKLSKTQLNATADVEGTFTYSPAIGKLLNAGMDQKLKVDFTPVDGNYNPVSYFVNINVLKINAVIEWLTPDDIVYGTLLSDKQLNAKANLSGTFTYSPSKGTKLNAGYFTELSVTFKPEDSTNVNTVNVTNYLSVLKAKPVITWSNPADIVYGTFLDMNQLNATSDVPGLFVYTPNWGSIMKVGEKQPITLCFTPDDRNNYSIVYDTVSINVKKATGITENKIIDLNLYPNPATECFSVEGFSGVAAVNVYDYSGKLVISKQIAEKEMIKLESLAQGLYVVKVETESGQAIKKLLKK